MREYERNIRTDVQHFRLARKLYYPFDPFTQYNTNIFDFNIM